MFKLLVECATRTKKCLADPTASLQDIIDEIRSKFDVSGSFHIQYLDKELNEWIDLDSTDELSSSEYTKLRVVLENQPPELQASSSRSSTPVAVGLPCDMTPPRQSPIPPIPQIVNSPLLPELLPELSTPSTSTKVKENKRKLKQWPKIYSVPKHTIPLSTIAKLDNNSLLTPRDRRDILTGIYQDVASHEGGLYPTGDRYDAIVDAIFREYPNIPVNEGLSLTNSRDLWRERLKVKFSNSRRRIDGDLPDIIARKKKKVSSEVVQENAVISTTWGLKNYLPCCPETEDEISIKNHIEWMKREHKKRENIDHGGADRRMSLTLAHRRRMIVEEDNTINDILVEFPWLTSVKELIKEFLRLGPQLVNRDVINSFESNLLKYGPSLEGLTKSRKKAEMANKIRDRIKDIRGETDRKYAEQCSALLSISSLFKEDVEKVLKTDTDYQTCDEPGRIALCYDGDILANRADAFKLVVEGVVVFRSNDLTSAFIGLMMAIYAFNLAYPKEINRTLILLQKVFIGLDDESVPDRTLLKVMAQINQGLVQ